MNDEPATIERPEEKTAPLEKRVDNPGRRDGAEKPADTIRGKDGAPVRKNGGKRRIVLLVLAVLLLAGLFFGVPAYLNSRNYESTDDAFVEGHVVQIDAKVSAYVASIHFDDNTPVNKGDLLVELDPRDLDVALQRARTQLAQAKAQVLQAQAGVEQSRAKLTQAQAMVIQQGAQVTQMSAQSDLAGVNFNRDTSLYTRDIKAIAKTNVDTTKSNYDAAQAMVNAARANLDAAKANVEAEHSSVDAADAQLGVAQATVGTAEAGVRDAELQLSYGKIYAGQRPGDAQVGRAGRLRDGGPGAAFPGAERGVGDGELQGNATHPHAAGTAGGSGGRCVPGSDVAGQGAERAKRHRCAVQRAAAGERDGQLREGHPARAGEDHLRRSAGAAVVFVAGHERGAAGEHFQRAEVKEKCRMQKSECGMQKVIPLTQ